MPTTATKLYVGAKINNLTILSDEIVIHQKNRCLRCRCSCGNDCLVRLSRLQDATQVSCGCKNKYYRQRRSRQPIAATPQNRTLTDLLNPVGLKPEDVRTLFSTSLTVEQWADLFNLTFEELMAKKDRLNYPNNDIASLITCAATKENTENQNG